MVRPGASQLIMALLLSTFAVCVDSRSEDMSSPVRALDTTLTSSVCSSELEVLKVQLRQAQEKAERVQKQVRGTCGRGAHHEG